jgi:catecholate siderophore receptor
VSTTGVSQPLPPEQNEAFEAGAKFDLLKGNLSLTGAAFQITKYNARSSNADNTFTAAGTIQVKGVRTGVAGRLTPEWQVFGGYTYLDARITNGVAPARPGWCRSTHRKTRPICGQPTLRETYEIGGGPPTSASASPTTPIRPRACIRRFDMTAPTSSRSTTCASTSSIC